MSVKNVKKTEKRVQSAVVSYRKNSTWAQMIDIDALVKNQKRSNFFSRVLVKNQENHPEFG